MEKYKTVYKDLYYKIKSGTIATGTVFTESEPAITYGVSKITVKSALALLQSDGLVRRIRHKGTVVLPIAVQKIPVVCMDFASSFLQ